MNKDPISSSDFNDLRLPSYEDSGCESEEVDQDVRDTIYAHMFFTSDQSVSSVEHAVSPSNQDLSVSLVVDKDKRSKRLKNLTRVEKKALKKLRKDKRKSKTNKSLLDISSCTDDPSFHGDQTSSSHRSIESPLANVGTTVKEAVKKGKKTKGSASDVIVISDTEPPAGDVILIDSSDSDSEDSLHFDDLANTADRDSNGDGASNGMELCDQGDLDTEGISADWAICKKDQLGRAAYERLFEKGLGDRPGRYYNDKEKGGGGAKCSNCKQRDHTNKNCPWPKRHNVCHFCAGLGHMSSKCPQSQCSYCYQPSHRGRRCTGPCGRIVDCGRCYMQGHHASICPDQWRQFHNTNYSHDEIVTIHPRDQRTSTKVFCFNCAAHGHYGFECTKTRPQYYCRATTSLIAQYNMEFWPPRNIDQIRQNLGIPPTTTPQTSSKSSGSKGRKGSKHGRGKHDQHTGNGTKHRGKHSRSYDERDQYDIQDQYDVRDQYDAHGRGGHPSSHGNQPKLHRDNYREPDFERGSDRRHSTGQSHDFPRTPLLPPPRGIGYPLFPPPPHFTPSHRHGPPAPTFLPPPPVHPHRRFSDVPPAVRSHDQRRQSHDHHYSHDSAQRSHDRGRRSHDQLFTPPPHKRHRTAGDDYYTPSRGFRGSPHTARTLDSHAPKHYRY
ncbi:zinc finger CCHC domain-containing protein 7-like isoform X2 [Halichondria panicea]|uniref:zinc finger CCHC domain-containing protein 7-like isoform X2 n=1 Tax=Halichondria panicea TaxID=6063 RepID=UPI00312BC435